MDVTLYSEHPEDYNELQNKRPDYPNAIETFLVLADKYLSGRKNLRVADFCAGTGANTRLLASRIGKLDTATLIDINQQFLWQAEKIGIDSNKTQFIVGDVVDVQIQDFYDVVLSIFAYHHLHDEHKPKFVKRAWDILDKTGVLIIGEIYLENQESVQAYYRKLYEGVIESDKSKELKEFLKQTADSSDFEFKVSQSFAHKQFGEIGFTLCDSIKIWPKHDIGLKSDEGMFVEIWKKV